MFEQETLVAEKDKEEMFEEAPDYGPRESHGGGARNDAPNAPYQFKIASFLKPFVNPQDDVVQKQEEDTPNMTGVPDDVKEGFESQSGFSFDDVRVHYNSDKPANLQALAYTQGNQVHIAPGQEQHLEHE
jgi:hypothetical protein